MALIGANRAILPNDLDAYWMPITANREFKQSPRLLARARDMHYYSPEGRAVLDATAGLCGANAGHCRAPIVEAVRAQAGELDFAPSFQFGHPKAFALASRIAALAPGDLNHVFFTNSGSEAVDTALKIALAFHNLRGEGARQKLIGREHGYHGANFGGIAVGGIPAHRKLFGTLFAGVDHMRSTYDRGKQAFTKGEPEWGAHLADDLERIVNLHDCSTIAAVIVEPTAGATKVLPPPEGYLKRLRSICDKYDILLIFDEFVGGFGSFGHAFAAARYGVLPDMITFGAGITSGIAPMGGVIVREPVYNSFMHGGPDDAVEFFHGYPFSAHPICCAAGLAALDLYEKEDLFARALRLEPIWADAVHGLHGLPSVLDIRSVGVSAAIDLAAKPAARGKRGFAAMDRAFRDFDLLLRGTGDTIILMPALIVGEAQIGEIVEKTARAIRAVA
ncbi:MAG: aminotransferase class III-fold pyridoxal phosphate-dependent enzyme [Methylocella sp.]